MREMKVNIRLKAIREELGYTQERFAEFLDMSLSGYKKIESGEVNLSVDKIYIINERLGISADYFLFDKRTELPNVWEQVYELPELGKWKMFLRLYAYLLKKTKDEALVVEMIEAVDHVVNDFFEDKNNGE